MDCVTDTHSLVWYFTEDARLSENALNAFEESLDTGSIIVPTVVLAEVMYICQKGRISLTFGETLSRLEECDNFQIVPLNVGILRTADNIGVGLEMHDQLIIATTVYFGMPLITRDRRIRESKMVEIVW